MQKKRFQMSEIRISGSWKGMFTQALDEDEHTYYEANFSMKLTGDSEAFEGTCEDLEIEVGKKERAKVRGFVDEGMISMVKEYEHLILLDRETKEFILDKEMRHPEIHYYGTFNDSTNRFEGTWEIESFVGNLGAEENLMYVEFGEWWMEREDA